MDLKTQSDVFRKLERECKKTRSMAKWAKAHGFSRGYISKVLLGKRELTHNLCSALGFVQIPIFILDGRDVTEKEIREWAKTFTKEEENEIVLEAKINVPCNRCGYYKHYCKCLNRNTGND